MKKLVNLSLVLFFLAVSVVIPSQARTVYRYSDVNFLNFDELETLSHEKHLDSNLENKMNELLETVVLRKDPLADTPLHRNHKVGKDFLRIAYWNIERGHYLDHIKSILNGTYLENSIDRRIYREGTSRVPKLQDEYTAFRGLDVLMLSEADLGMDRTDYRNVAKELADQLGAAYAFSPEFIEVEPRTLEKKNIDKSRYKGLHGNAIISKYPIEAVSRIELPLCYDWFLKEKRGIFPTEAWRRIGTALLFDEHIHREVRRGNRFAMRADLRLPNDELVSLINVHLENRTPPKCRIMQIESLLESIKDIKNPVVLGGDLNSFEIDASPTSVFRMVANKAADPDFLARFANGLVNPLAIIINPSLVTVSLFRKYRNPAVKHIPFLFPNKGYPLFTTIRDFVFNDGKKFLFEKEDDESYLAGRKGLLGTSNQRVIKGYKSTFRAERDYMLVRFKYDWFFVKPDARFDEEGKTVGERHYFPAFARTLNHLNHSLDDGKSISDHSPITLDLMI